MIVLLAATAILYLWGLGASGWANAYYSAAAQAGSASWKALFFGSFDAASAITVDKTPASLWVMGLSARIFGVNSWSILVPEALMGVATVGLLYAAVARWFGRNAGLLAGAVLAVTPVATLMFRFNNPDALLVLLLVAGAYAVVRSLERGSVRWLMFAGALVGFGFLAKMLQAFLVVPAFALVYLVAAPVSLWRRVWHLLAAGAAMLVAGGWWVAIVELWPASSRPYIGGSQNNSVLELALGYNGLGRLTGDETGSVGGGGGGGWGATGWTRLFDAEIGGQISWLLPAALLLLAAGVVVTWRAPRVDRTRAALLLWGGWLVVTGVVFSQMQGIFHAYYTVALAPAVGAVVGIGASLFFRRFSGLVLAGAVVLTALWSYVLLGRSPDFLPWLRPAIVVVGLVAAVLLVVSQRLHADDVSPAPDTSALDGSPAGVGAAGVGAAGVGAARVRMAARWRPALPWAARVAAVAAIAAALAAPLAYSVQTAAAAHTGAIPSAGPAVVGGNGGGPGGRPGFAGGGGAGGPGGAGFRGQNGRGQAAGGTGTVPGGANAAPGGTGGANAAPGGAGGANAGPGGAGGFGGGRGGAGGLLNAGTPSAELVNLLKADADRYTWAAAAVGANNAAGIQLGTGLPVMAIGGFNGSDPAPTLAQFQQYVADGKIHYFIGGGGFGGMRADGGSSASQEIAAWVQENYTAQTVGNVTLYDLSQ